VVALRHPLPRARPPFLGLLAGPRIGAYAYDALHTTIGPLAVLAFGFFAGIDLAVSIGLIWLAHVGLDQALGYGIRYPGSFAVTNLGRKGSRASTAI
jgi:hypothetical protein